MIELKPIDYVEEVYSSIIDNIQYYDYIKTDEKDHLKYLLEEEMVNDDYITWNGNWSYTNDSTKACKNVLSFIYYNQDDFIFICKEYWIDINDFDNREKIDVILRIHHLQEAINQVFEYEQELIEKTFNIKY